MRERTFESVRPCVAVHDVRVDALGILVPDPEAVCDARGHVVMDHVRTLDELERDLQAARMLHVECDGLLAALATEERFPGEAHAITRHRLHLDHARTKVTHDHRAERTGEVLTEVDDENVFECRHQTTAPAIAWISVSEYPSAPNTSVLC